MLCYVLASFEQQCCKANVTLVIEYDTVCCMYTVVTSYHFEIQHSVIDDGQSDRIQYTHVMARGRTNERHYGQ